MDAPSSVEEHFVFGAFFPRSLKVRPRDSVIFENRSSHDVHTVTFGVKADRSDAPSNATRTVQANPAVFRSCFTDTDPTRDLEACPRVAPGEATEARVPYGGKGYWNSGALAFPGAPGPAPKATTVQLSPTIAPGTYAFVCLLHPRMNGQLEVVGKDADRLSPATVSAAGNTQLGQAKAGISGLKEPVRQLSGGPAVTAGWGDEIVAVDRFSPMTISVKPGDTVTWTGQSPYMPHTITFASPFRSLDEPNVFLPAGARSGSAYPGGLAHSGAIGPPPEFPTNSFSLQFTKAGSYTYVCVLHPGMAGVVEVE